MTRAQKAVVVFATVLAACGGGGTSAANCSEYAAELRTATADMTSDEVSRYIDDTAEDVARLIQADQQDAEVCASAVLEVLFSSGVDDLFGEFDD